GGRPAAPGGQKAGLRPRHHGKPLPFHHCGLLQPADLLPDRDGGVPLVYELTNQKFPAVMPAAGDFLCCVFNGWAGALWKTYSSSTLSASVMGRRGLQGLP